MKGMTGKLQHRKREVKEIVKQKELKSSAPVIGRRKDANRKGPSRFLC